MGRSLVRLTRMALTGPVSVCGTAVNGLTHRACRVMFERSVARIAWVSLRG